MRRRSSSRSGCGPATLLGALLAAVLVAACVAPRCEAASAVEIRTLPLSDPLEVVPARQTQRDAHAVLGDHVAPLAPQAATHPTTTASSRLAAVRLDTAGHFTMLGLLCDEPAAGGPVGVRLRTSLDGSHWGGWYEASLELADEAGVRRAYIEAMWTGEGRYVEVSAFAEGGNAPLALAGVRLIAIDTASAPPSAEGAAAAVGRATADVVRAPADSVAQAQPALVTRAGWGADESMRNGSPVIALVKMAFVHHTAGGNSYTSGEAPSMVRGIYAYHTRSLGWSDIGYNFLIDRFGTIYEGRAGGPDKGVVGAQVLGFNTGSTGVAVIGTYASEAPPPSAVDALETLLAWKLARSGLDPTGTAVMRCGSTEKYKAGQNVSLPVISGHRDANYTACPGDALYASLPGIRAAVAARLKAGTALPLPYSVSLELSSTRVTAGTTVTFFGRVANASGAAARGTVTLQRRAGSDGAWAAWRTAALDGEGAYAIRVAMTKAPREWRLRAVMPADAVALAGQSAEQVLSVVPAARSRTQESAFTISGHGWGHGIGLSQWGAYGYARHGWTYRAVLRHYYTGIGFGAVKNPTVRVLLQAGLDAVKLTCSRPFTVRGSGAAVTIPAGTTATTTYVNGTYRVVAGSLRRDFAAAVTFTPKKGLLDVLTLPDLGGTGPRRGTIRIVRSGSALAMVNHVSLESYLRSVVPHEVPASWPVEALKAQTCAARSYAAASLGGSGQWDLYCDVRSQAYGGTAWEDPRTDAAVKATAGVVPVYGGKPIRAFYFSSSGGRTESIELVWETSPLPYLKGVSDPYDHYAPRHDWGPLRLTSEQITSRLGTAVKGSLRAICRLEAGTSPRIVKAAVMGSEGVTLMHGSVLRQKLGLNSSWATLKSVSISPAAGDAYAVEKGEDVTLWGRVYPALAAGAAVTLLSRSRDGEWRTRSVPTLRHTQSIGDGTTTRYSSFHVRLTPTTATTYYVRSGSARSPTTTIAVD